MIHFFGRRALLASLGVVVLTIAVAAVACRNEGSKTSAADDASAVVILLENNTLVTLDKAGRVLERARLGRNAESRVVGRYLSVLPSRDLGVVVSGKLRDRLLFVSPGGRIDREIALPTGVRFRAIEADRTTGRVYLAGEHATTRRTEFEGFAQEAVLTVISRAGQVVSTRTLRRPGDSDRRFGPLDWRVYDIAVAPDERRVVVSYHGPNTGGADWVDLEGTTPMRCTSQASEACIERVHGAIEGGSSGILAALGTPPHLASFSWDGTHMREWPSGLENAHLMEFARSGDMVLTIESCTKTGGMTAVALDASRTRILHPPAFAAPLDGLPERAICGERISVGAGRLVAVMKRGTITGIGGVLLLDGNGTLIKWLRLKPPPIDILVLP